MNMQTNMQTRLEDARRAMAKKSLESCPWLLFEKVADHYASLAHLAMQLKRMVDETRFSGRSENIDQVMTYALQIIHASHCDTFGYPPAWPITIEKLLESLSATRTNAGEPNDRDIRSF